uniref:ILEI/PANDER domain-containing protein n=1 Tax=Acanthochromis polyacanthus TaxID=80966 RepID=A0A3Q1H274_9TELE
CCDTGSLLHLNTHLCLIFTSLFTVDYQMNENITKVSFSKKIYFNLQFPNVYSSTQMSHLKAIQQKYSSVSLCFLVSQCILGSVKDTNDFVSLCVALLTSSLCSNRFDTYRSKNESRRLAKYVDGVEAGLILAMVVNDEGSNNLEDSAKKSISRLGSHHISSLGFRHPWTFIVTKGNVSSAVEDHDVYQGKNQFLVFASKLELLHLEMCPCISF